MAIVSKISLTHKCREETNVVRRDQSQWRYCSQQRLHQPNGQTWNKSPSGQVRVGLGRYPVRWSIRGPGGMRHTTNAVQAHTHILQTLPYATEKFGRKIALYIIWVMFVAVSKD